MTRFGERDTQTAAMSTQIDTSKMVTVNLISDVVWTADYA